MGMGITNDPTREQSKRFASNELTRSRQIRGLSGRYRMNESSEVSFQHESIRPLVTQNENNEVRENSNLDIKPEPKTSKMQQLITSFSWITAFDWMKKSKCYEWDNRELDVLEAFKFISFAMI
jgi:hypothetical protein